MQVRGAAKHGQRRGRTLAVKRSATRCMTLPVGWMPTQPTTARNSTNSSSMMALATALAKKDTDRHLHQLAQVSTNKALKA